MKLLSESDVHVDEEVGKAPLGIMCDRNSPQTLTTMHMQESFFLMVAPKVLSLAFIGLF